MAELFAYIPSKFVKFRVFALDHDHDRLLAGCTEEVFRGAGSEGHDAPRRAASFACPKRGGV